MKQAPVVFGVVLMLSWIFFFFLASLNALVGGGVVWVERRVAVLVVLREWFSEILFYKGTKPHQNVNCWFFFLTHIEFWDYNAGVCSLKKHIIILKKCFQF
jgi:hypothetical membrane protein